MDSLCNENICLDRQEKWKVNNLLCARPCKCNFPNSLESIFDWSYIQRQRSHFKCKMGTSELLSLKQLSFEFGKLPLCLKYTIYLCFWLQMGYLEFKAVQTDTFCLQLFCWCYSYASAKLPTLFKNANATRGETVQPLGSSPGFPKPKGIFLNLDMWTSAPRILHCSHAMPTHLEDVRVKKNCSKP